MMAKVAGDTEGDGGEEGVGKVRPRGNKGLCPSLVVSNVEAEPHDFDGGDSK